MTRPPFLSALLGIGLCVPSVVWAGPVEIAKARNPVIWQISPKKGPSVTIAMVLQDVGGKIALCGAMWPTDEGRKIKESQDRFFGSTVKVRGKPLDLDLRNLPLYQTRDAADVFGCAVSSAPWEGPYLSKDWKLSIPKIPED